MANDYKAAAAFRNLREIDRALLDQIVQAGDDLSEARHTLLFFYEIKERGRASFDLIVGDSAQYGLSVSVQDGDSLILEGQQYVDPDRLKPLLDWAVRIANEANADFDGWECALIERQN